MVDETFDPVERALEKQVQRQKDADDIASGRRAIKEVRRANGLFAFPRVRLDSDGAERLW